MDFSNLNMASPSTKFYLVLSMLVVLLIVASITGAILKNGLKHKRDSDPKKEKIVLNLVSRVNAWWIMSSVFALFYLWGTSGLLVLFGLMSYLALREYMTLTPTRIGDHSALSLSFFVLLPLQYYLIGISWYSMFTILIPVYAFILLPCIVVLSQDVENFIERTSRIQWGVMISVYCLSYAPALLTLNIPNYEGQAGLLLFYLLLISQLSDVMQYIYGTLIGKTKIAPVISPNKTVEGLIGGGLTSVLIGASLWWITPFTPLQSALMSSVIVVMGFLGGLVLSAVKRSVGAKDWGSIIKGHGGMMDRLDSVCFSAPIFFHLVRYFYA